MNFFFTTFYLLLAAFFLSWYTFYSDSNCELDGTKEIKNSVGFYRIFIPAPLPKLLLAHNDDFSKLSIDMYSLAKTFPMVGALSMTLSKNQPIIGMLGQKNDLSWFFSTILVKERKITLPPKKGDKVDAPKRTEMQKYVKNQIVLYSQPTKTDSGPPPTKKTLWQFAARPPGQQTKVIQSLSCHEGNKWLNGIKIYPTDLATPESNLGQLFRRPICTILLLINMVVAYRLWNDRVPVESVAFSYDLAFGMRNEYWRGVTATFSHFDVFHIGFNIMSLYGLSVLEETIPGGSVAFFCSTLVLIVGTMIMCVVQIEIYSYIKQNQARGSDQAGVGSSIEQMKAQLSVGFSCVLFAYMVAVCVRLPRYCPIPFFSSLCFDTYHLPLFAGIELPFNFAPFMLLIFTKFFIPRSSFVGHLAGIILGFPFAWGWIDWISPDILGIGLFLMVVAHDESSCSAPTLLQGKLKLLSSAPQMYLPTSSVNEEEKGVAGTSQALTNNNNNHYHLLVAKLRSIASGVGRILSFIFFWNPIPDVVNDQFNDEDRQSVRLARWLYFGFLITAAADSIFLFAWDIPKLLSSLGFLLCMKISVCVMQDDLLIDDSGRSYGQTRGRIVNLSSASLSAMMAFVWLCVVFAAVACANLGSVLASSGYISYHIRQHLQAETSSLDVILLNYLWGFLSPSDSLATETNSDDLLKASVIFAHYLIISLSLIKLVVITWSAVVMLDWMHSRSGRISSPLSLSISRKLQEFGMDKANWTSFLLKFRLNH